MLRQLVVASHPLVAGARLSARDLAIVHWPANGIGPSMLAEPAALIGRELAVAVASGEPVAAGGGRSTPRTRYCECA